QEQQQVPQQEQQLEPHQVPQQVPQQEQQLEPQQVPQQEQQLEPLQEQLLLPQQSVFPAAEKEYVIGVNGLTMILDKCNLRVLQLRKLNYLKMPGTSPVSRRLPRIRYPVQDCRHTCYVE
ncbi:hydroxysteroid dehydrogenase-like protein 2, partial [Lytechinus variegatus]|uniref:hydroxysteroid dehydrogenase-like protein 2 n=1 Tax=Lytechinus variegatus TaxID=7654 RepID=UPI001BB0FEF8